MINYDMTYGNEEFEAIADLEMKSAECVRLRKRYAKGFGFAGAAAAVLAISQFGNLGNGYAFASCFCFAILASAFLTLCFCSKKTQYRKLKKTAEMMIKAESEKRTYGFDDDKITICSELGNTIIFWSAVSGYGEIRHYIWIRLKNARYILIDKNLMPAENLEQVKEYLTVKAGK